MYLEQSEDLTNISDAENIPAGRLLRECFNLVIDDDELLIRVIAKCREVTYRKTGVNKGVWKQEVRKRNAKKKTQT